MENKVTSEANMENKKIENHAIKSEEHLMQVDGQVLKEKKITTFIEGRHSGMEDNWDAKEIVEITRRIENHESYRRLHITEHFIEGFITGYKVKDTDIKNGNLRNMTEKEEEQFENDWDKFTNLAFLNSQITPRSWPLQ